MIKLSELKDDVKVIHENSATVYTVKDVKDDLQYWKDEGVKFYTTSEYQASIDAKSMLESAIECEYDNMYEDWDQNIWNDITDEDIEKLQFILDDILNRDKENNIAYHEDKQIDIFN